MVHAATELKKRKRINPATSYTESEVIHYCDVARQNECLRVNLFDSLGNYLYCDNCIRSSFQISKGRLTHKRKVKQQESEQLIVQMTN